MFTIISSFKNESKNIEEFKVIIENSLQEIKISELVLIDNGSTDNTYDKLNEMHIKNINIKVFKNPINSGYGDGFNLALQKATQNYVITLHSDNQFKLDNFLKKNKKLILEKINKKINIFPKRVNRNFFASFRTLLVRTILSILLFRLIPDYGGHPKFLIKKNLVKTKNLPRNFSFDLCLYLYLVKRKFKCFTNICTVEEKRNLGKSTWSKNLFNQLKLLFDFLYSSIIYYYKDKIS